MRAIHTPNTNSRLGYLLVAFLNRRKKMKLKAIKLLFPAILISIALLEMAHAQNPEIAAIGTGARSRGMGKAFLAVSDDATAISWNPAGLIQLERPEFSVVVLGSSYKNDSSPASGGSTKSYGYLDFASIAYPTLVGEKAAVFAIAYQQQADFTYLGRKPFNFNTGGAGNTEAEVKGGNYAVSPSFAIQLTNTFWLGAALNIQRQKSTAVVGSISLPQETVSWGKNRTLNLGFMLDLDKTRLGFIARPRLGGEKATGLPLTFGAGVSHRPNDALTIAADVEYARWFELTPGRIHPAAGLTLGRTVDVRLGFEYVKKTDFGVIPLRAGLLSTQSPIRQLSNGRYSGDVPRSPNLTLGAGVAMQKAAINVAYELQLKKVSDNIAGLRIKDDIKHHRITVSAVVYLGE